MPDCLYCFYVDAALNSFLVFVSKQPAYLSEPLRLVVGKILIQRMVTFSEHAGISVSYCTAAQVCHVHGV